MFEQSELRYEPKVNLTYINYYHKACITYITGGVLTTNKINHNHRKRNAKRTN